MRAAISESKVSKSSSQTLSAKREKKAARQLLRAVDEEGAAGSAPRSLDQHTDPAVSEVDRAPGSREALTQEHIVQLFDGDLDEFATFTSSDHRAAGRRVTYVVENEVSGDFFRVRGTHQRRKHGDDSRRFTILSSASTRFPFRKLDSEDPLAAHEAPELGAASLRDLETALVVMCQGILTGLCWMDAFNLSSSAAFACAYSAPMDTVSLLGLTKKLGRLASEQDAAAAAQDWEAETPGQRRLRKLSSRLLAGASVLTLASLLVLLIATPSATRLSHAYASDTTWCASAAPISALFRTSVSTLRASAICNAVLMSGAWFCVAVQCHLGLSAGVSSQYLLADLQRTFLRQDKRMEQLHGRRLERMSVDELKQLIKTHQDAVEATESLLVTKLQLQH